MKKFTLFLAALCCTVMANAERIQFQGIWYETDPVAKTAIVTYETLSTDGSNYASLTSVNLELVCLDEYGNSYRIIGIGEKAFHSNNTITDVDIPAFVKTIGRYAFNNAKALRFIYLSNSELETIEEYAFYGCSALNSVVTPSSLKTIGQYAFCNCPALENVHINEGATSIGNCAFRWCSGLKYLRLPSTLTSMGDYAFQNCASLKEMHCHLASPIDLGEHASITFANAPATAKVYVAGNPADFRNAAGWNILPIQDDILVTSDGFNYICHTDHTATLTWDTHELKGNYIKLSGAKQIPSSVTIGGNEYMVKRIAKKALMYAFNITELTISDEVTTIDSAAFVNCGMTTLNLPAHIKTIPEDMCHNVYRLIEIKIPDEVDTIKYNAFCGCSALSKLILPAGLKYIESYAFNSCSELKRIYNYNPVPIVFHTSDATTIFRNVPCADVTLFVPFGSKEAYEAALVWKDFYIEQFDPHEGIDEVQREPSGQYKSTKVIKDGQVLIERNGKIYNTLGAEIQ